MTDKPGTIPRNEAHNSSLSDDSYELVDQDVDNSALSTVTAPDDGVEENQATQERLAKLEQAVCDSRMLNRLLIGYLLAQKGHQCDNMIRVVNDVR